MEKNTSDSNFFLKNLLSEKIKEGPTVSSGFV